MRVPKSVDTIVVTNLPSFYKINLYNRIAEYRRLLVVFTGDGAEGRNRDFYRGDKYFDFVFLNNNRALRLLQLLAILRRVSYSELQLGGWDSLPLWLAAYCSPKSANSLVVESSYIESTIRGLRGWLKQRFVRRVSKVYASGSSQRRLVKMLGFEGKTIITRGVGVFNYVEQPAYVARDRVSRFLYVGRLTAVKNLRWLIEVFNTLPHLSLTIVGFGEQEAELKSLAADNIEFAGAVDNNRLSEVYQRHDVFVLPSLSEPWGLVVEEALNNGLPVLVSDRVGCADEIVRDGENGLVFRCGDKADLCRKLSEIQSPTLYNNLRLNICKMRFDEIASAQVKCYL